MKKGGKVNLHIRLAFAHAKRAAQKIRTVANLGIGALCSQKHRLAETENKHFFVSLENFIHGGVFFPPPCFQSTFGAGVAGEGLTDGGCRLRKITNTDTEHDDK